MESVDRTSFRAQMDEQLGAMKAALTVMKLATLLALGLVVGLAVQELFFRKGPHQSLAEAVQGPEEEKVSRRAADWLGSKGLDHNLYLQCKADGECALTYTRNGVLHGGIVRCYDKGCIAVSGW